MANRLSGKACKHNGKRPSGVEQIGIEIYMTTKSGTRTHTKQNKTEQKKKKKFNIIWKELHMLKWNRQAHFESFYFECQYHLENAIAATTKNLISIYIYAQIRIGTRFSTAHDPFNHSISFGGV